jgi:hypothetical protein
LRYGWKDHQVTDSRPNEPAGEPTFSWHPVYHGRSGADVRRELADEIARDQRAYQLALEGAERAENQSLASVMELEKRWGVYSFDWADMDPDELAGRIVDFELARERRQELFPYAEYREDARRTSAAAPTAGRGAAMTDEQRRRVANLGAAVIMVILAIIVIGIIIAVL